MIALPNVTRYGDLNIPVRGFLAPIGVDPTSTGMC